MAECEKMMQLCEASLEQALSKENQQVLDKHLAECPACAAYLADLRFLAAALEEVPEPPAELHEKIMSGILDEVHSTIVQTHRPNRRMPVVTMLVAAAACVVLVLSGALDGVMNTVHFGMGGGMDASSSMSGGAAVDNTAPAPMDSAESAEEGNGTTTAGAADAGSAVEPFVAKASEPQEQANDGMEDPAAMPRNAGIPEVFSDAAEGSEDAVPFSKSREAVPPQPQVAAFISGVMGDEIFAACYLVEGGSGLPELGQEQQRDSNFAYYVADNNLAQLETMLDSLEKAGFTVNLYEESGVLFNETAKHVIFVVRME